MKVTEIFSEHAIFLKPFYLDSKRLTEDQLMEKVSLVKKSIKNFAPDLIISCDDVALKYIIHPHYRNSKTPVVLCGLNCAMNDYGLPYMNATGMFEDDMIEKLIKQLSLFSKGKRIAFIRPNTLTGKQIEDNNGAYSFAVHMKTYEVKNFADCKKFFLKVQKEADMLVLFNKTFDNEWDKEKAIKFFRDNSSIPTGSTITHMSDYVAFTMGKDPLEFGRYAALTAIEILKGKAPAEIPMVNNRHPKIIVNMRIAEKLGITVPISLLRTADIIHKIR
jgi:hypothetical protein